MIAAGACERSSGMALHLQCRIGYFFLCKSVARLCPRGPRRDSGLLTLRGRSCRVQVWLGWLERPEW